MYETHPYWTLKGLKEKTRQPESYLKEVMATVAIMQRRGPYAGTWKLMEMYEKKVVETGEEGGKKEESGAKGEVVGDASLAGPSGGGYGGGGYGGPGSTGGGIDEDDDDGSDEDEDMEEV